MKRKTKSYVVLGILAISASVLFTHKQVKADITPKQQELIIKHVEEKQTDFVPGQLIVGMTPSVPLDSSNRKNDNLFGINAKIVEDLSLEKVTKDRQNNQVLLIEFDTEIEISQAIETLIALPEVEYAEPNYIVKMDDTDAKGLSSLSNTLASANNNLIIPNDDNWWRMWGLAKIDMPSVWGQTTGSKNVKVAVIDSGIDYNHEDLKDNVQVELGYDFVDNDTNPNDGHGHGTHVAGTIGAKGNNRIGIPGINWDITLVPIRVLNNANSGTSANFVKGINWATDKNIPLINYSIQSTGYNYSIEQAITNYPGLFIACAGNYGQDYSSLPIYPASLNISNMISVGNSNAADQRSSKSSYSKTGVDLFAPGESIYSTKPGNQYDYDTGTSMATPHVTGSAALALSQNSSLSTKELKDSILESVDKIDTLKELCQTGGRLNTSNLLRLTGDISSNPSDTWDKDKTYWGGDRVIYNGKQYEAKWWNKNSQPDQSGENGPWKLV
ncbi:S8 family serine peptidase [Lactococcus taiwanensis]|uniref:S8 family serine peptidase n=1 Tax=Lactococcus taiwanensis TaxID=1151742 RepID=UPI0035711C82